MDKVEGRHKRVKRREKGRSGSDRTLDAVSLLNGSSLGSSNGNGSLEAFHVSSGIDGWENWIERFGFFAEVNSVPQARQRSLLFTYCGPALYNLVKEAVALEKPDTKSLDEIVEAVRGRLDLIPGVFPARAEFYNRKQLPGESVATFMSNLRHQARRCQFEAAPTVAERIDLQLQDQFMIGMSDAATRRRVLRGPKITLKEL
ncbi:hypothetical protein TTRE_0000313901 [Trichuris trichiura]|uniref:Retrotransposon gag domain-containing protein n=1 Tax=Trichuris trichiura TaxID=36087 RepID=A0A077Z4U5_TRITR|nr:hypothetical protein TTRE_0000313901 [Trichuris trichiura]